MNFSFRLHIFACFSLFKVNIKLYVQLDDLRIKVLCGLNSGKSYLIGNSVWDGKPVIRSVGWAAWKGAPYPSAGIDRGPSCAGCLSMGSTCKCTPERHETKCCGDEDAREACANNHLEGVSLTWSRFSRCLGQWELLGVLISFHRVASSFTLSSCKLFKDIRWKWARAPQRDPFTLAKSSLVLDIPSAQRRVNRWPRFRFRMARTRPNKMGCATFLKSITTELPRFFVCHVIHAVRSIFTSLSFNLRIRVFYESTFRLWHRPSL